MSSYGGGWDCGTIRRMSFRDLDRLVELARQAERLAREVELTIGKATDSQISYDAWRRTAPLVTHPKDFAPR